MPGEGTCDSPVGQDSVGVSRAGGQSSLAQLVPFPLWPSATRTACASGRAGGRLMVIKFGGLGEGAVGVLLGEHVEGLSVLWSPGESCGSCIC